MATINSALDDVSERYRKREEVRSKNIDVLLKNDPKEILNVESKERIERRKSLIRNEDITLEGMVTGNDLMPINYLQRGQHVSEAICRIEVKDGTGRTINKGTGFMVSSSLLITNEHLLENFELCKRSIIQFHYEDDENFIPKDTVTFLLDPNLLFYKNEQLDFTLVGVNSQAIDGTPLSKFGYIKMIGGSGKALLGEYVSIIQHPNGDKKHIAIRENRVVDIFDNYVHYLTDSKSGSSGSPVFNDQWQVVALHHGGVPKRDNQGRVLSVDGAIWERYMGEDKIYYVANEGIRISKIIDDLKINRNNISTDSQRLLDQLIVLSSSV
jgi:endonuclease G, mitochondrial